MLKTSAPWLQRWLLRLLISGALLVALLTVVDLPQAAAAIGRLPRRILPLATALYGVSMVLATVRWRWLLVGYGAEDVPSLPRLMRLQLHGLFYNTYIPGAVGGDVVRAWATRGCMKGGAGTGLPAAATVVVVERITGLVGLLLLASTAWFLRPIAGGNNLWLWSGAGVVGGAALIAALAWSPRVSSRKTPSWLRWTASVPAPRAWSPLVLAVLCAIASHAVVALVGHIAIVHLDAQVALADSMCLVPMATAAAYFPLTLAGAGAFEGAMLFLYGSLGVAPADALATAVTMQAAKLIVAGSGGLVAWLNPGEALTVRSENLIESPAPPRANS